MRVLEIENGIMGYGPFVEYVWRNGKRRDPRGIATFDAGPMTVVIKDINWTLPLHIGRNINRKIAAAEAVQLIGGFTDPELLFWASPNFKQFAEDDGRFWGPYGRRIRDQVAHVITKLKRDVDSRQAVITLWDPFFDNQPNKRDYPCTVMMHFAIIDARLEMTVTMRSQDVWWGTPYDWFQFTQLQHTVARLLHVHPGTYRHITLSTHLYERNMPDVEKLLVPPHEDMWEWQPRGIGRQDDTIHVTRTRAQGLISPEIAANMTMTESERWYVEQFKGYAA